MDEMLQQRLSGMQDAMDAASENVDTGGFEEGDQLVFIKDVRVSDNFNDGVARVIFSIGGAEEKNSGKDTVAMFKVTGDPEENKFIIRFIRKLGFTDRLDMSNLSGQLTEALKDVAFFATVKLSQGKDRVFVNVYPKRRATMEESIGAEKGPF